MRQGARGRYRGNIHFQGQCAAGVGRPSSSSSPGETSDQVSRHHLTCSAPTWPPTSTSSTSVGGTTRADHQRQERARVRADAVLRHPPDVQGRRDASRTGLRSTAFLGLQGRIAFTTMAAPVSAGDQISRRRPAGPAAGSAHCRPIHRADQFGPGTLMAAVPARPSRCVSGQGFVVVQPSESCPARSWPYRRRSTGRHRRVRRRRNPRQLPRR